MVKMTMTERMIKVETILEEHIKQGNIDHQEVLCSVKALNLKLDILGKTYANKWVEKAIISMGVTGLGVIVALIAYIL